MFFFAKETYNREIATQALIKSCCLYKVCHLLLICDAISIFCLIIKLMITYYQYLYVKT